MKTIEYTVQYTGAIEGPKGTFRKNAFMGSETETVRVQARDINSGFGKALKIANEPLGNGRRREIGAITFSQVL